MPTFSSLELPPCLIYDSHSFLPDPVQEQDFLANTTLDRPSDPQPLLPHSANEVTTPGGSSAVFHEGNGYISLSLDPLVSRASEHGRHSLGIALVKERGLSTNNITLCRAQQFPTCSQIYRYIISPALSIASSALTAGGAGRRQLISSSKQSFCK